MNTLRRQRERKRLHEMKMRRKAAILREMRELRNEYNSDPLRRRSRTIGSSASTSEQMLNRIARRINEGSLDPMRLAKVCLKKMDANQFRSVCRDVGVRG